MTPSACSKTRHLPTGSTRMVAPIARHRRFDSDQVRLLAGDTGQVLSSASHTALNAAVLTSLREPGDVPAPTKRLPTSDQRCRFRRGASRQYGACEVKLLHPGSTCDSGVRVQPVSQSP